MLSPIVGAAMKEMMQNKSTFLPSICKVTENVRMTEANVMAINNHVL